jgi:ABC-type transporter MlaC component
MSITRIVLFSMLVFLGTAHASPKEDSQDHSKIPSSALEQLVKQMNQETIAVASSDADKEVKLEKIFKQYFHVPAIAKHVLSEGWKVFTPTQRTEYLKLFLVNVTRAYLSFLDSFRDPLTILKTVPIQGKKNAYTLFCNVKNTHNKKEIDLRFTLFNGKIIDVFVEKASLVEGLKRDYRDRYRKAGKDPVQFLKNMAIGHSS